VCHVHWLVGLTFEHQGCVGRAKKKNEEESSRFMVVCMEGNELTDF